MSTGVNSLSVIPCLEGTHGVQETAELVIFSGSELWKVKIYCSLPKKTSRAV